MRALAALLAVDLNFLFSIFLYNLSYDKTFPDYKFYGKIVSKHLQVIQIISYAEISFEHNLEKLYARLLQKKSCINFFLQNLGTKVYAKKKTKSENEREKVSQLR